MRSSDLDTPSLLIDYDVVLANLRRMQDYANAQGVSLRAHTKTHKMPRLAKIQVELGAGGITVAKVGEAEVMVDNGLTDIFVANEVTGAEKLRRLSALSEIATIRFGADSVENIREAEAAFARASAPANLMIEIEVGEERSGIIAMEDFHSLLDCIEASPHVRFSGIFSHEGHCYNADSVADCRQKFMASQERTLEFAAAAGKRGMKPAVVSIGSTPSLNFGFEIRDGITEIRPGTYALMDASQANAIGTLEHCAATVLASIISRPTAERVIADVGAKGLTAQRRTQGICATPGVGTIKGFENVHVSDVFDEHAIILNNCFREQVEVGDKIEIYPVHICPVCNLYDSAYFISNGNVVEEVPILCRGKLR